MNRKTLTSIILVLSLSIGLTAIASTAGTTEVFYDNVILMNENANRLFISNVVSVSDGAAENDDYYEVQDIQPCR